MITPVLTSLIIFYVGFTIRKYKHFQSWNPFAVFNTEPGLLGFSLWLFLFFCGLLTGIIFPQVSDVSVAWLWILTCSCPTFLLLAEEPYIPQPSVAQEQMTADYALGFKPFASSVQVASNAYLGRGSTDTSSLLAHLPANIAESILTYQSTLKRETEESNTRCFHLTTELNETKQKLEISKSRLAESETGREALLRQNQALRSKGTDGTPIRKMTRAQLQQKRDLLSLEMRQIDEVLRQSPAKQTDEPGLL